MKKDDGGKAKDLKIKKITLKSPDALEDRVAPIGATHTCPAVTSRAG